MEKQLKIFLVSNMYPSEGFPSYGIFVKNVETGLQETGVEFPCKALIRGRSKNICIKLLNYFCFYFQIIWRGLFCEYDLIYIHYPTHSIIPVYLISRLRKKKIVANVHGSDLLEGKLITRILRKITKPLFRGVSLFIVPSEYFLEVIIKVLNAPKHKVHISPSGGIDGNTFFRKDKKTVRAKIGMQESGLIIGYVSRIVQGKGWDVLIRALDLLKKNNTDFICMMLGGGEQANELKKMIKERHLNNQIIYFGEQTQSKLPDFYNSFDLFVFPTRRNAESLGLVGIEAMMCGIPVIASRMAGPEGYIDDQNNGFLFAPGDHIDLYKKIIHYIQLDDKEKQRLESNCILMSQEFRKDKTIRSLTNKLREIKN